MAMTKADIVEALYEKVGFSKKEAADLVELVFDHHQRHAVSRTENQDFGIRQFRGARKALAHRPKSANRREHRDQRSSRADLPSVAGPARRSERGSKASRSALKP